MLLPRLPQLPVLRGLLSLMLVAAVADSGSAFQGPAGYIYDEDKVPPYVVNDPLVSLDGTRITSADQWVSRRRPELLKLIAELQYGKTPGGALEETTFVAGPIDENALDGKAIRREVIVRFTGKEDGPSMTILLFTPKDAVGKQVPCFLGLNFGGNHAVHPDKGITLNTGWFRDRADYGYKNNKATEQTRGTEASRWPVDLAISRGYAVATIYYGDIDPDFDDGFKNGVHPLFYKPGQTQPEKDEWGSIGAWAWGLSRALDYLETDPAIDAKKVAVLGHSRLGKASLWAGAQDERFAIVISNNSGASGAALSKRIFGETWKRINTSFPHWLCDNSHQFNDNEAALPFDQHELVALVAPRPVYIASAEEDLWADPHGEFLSGYHADPVYRLFGVTGIGVDSPTQPALNAPVQNGRIGYHVRTGKHDINRYDWEQYINFADKHFKAAK